MYSSKDNINILTALLIEHGVRHAVVCPGSRNAPIVHNLHEAGLCCHAVTDERSAGFFALGMAHALREAVAVCVTSGSALLNLAPAVAEAFYQQVPLVVISADRPQAWIGQLDGQTLPQQGALGCFVRRSVTLPEPSGTAERWHCNRLVNEALADMRRGADCPVHINVPVSEPLFEFTAADLPRERVIRTIRPTATDAAVAEEVAGRICSASRPLVVMGQHSPAGRIDRALEALSQRVTVLCEPLGSGSVTSQADCALSIMDNPGAFVPDFILYAGGTVVSKRLKQFLRGAAQAETWAVSADGDVHDTFCNQTAVVEGDAVEVLAAVADRMACNGVSPLSDEAAGYHAAWRSLLDAARRKAAAYQPRYSQMAAVKMFEEMLGDADYDYSVHYANSSAVRLGCIYAPHHIYVNRGINGIEGSLSAAAGFSAASGDMTFCVTGDLSFFYDSNALWNGSVGGNFRVLLLNNACGGIFKTLGGLSDSPVCDSYVAGAHHSSAHGICDAHDIGYLAARDGEELARRMETFLYSGTHRPLLFEVFTDAGEDAAALSEFYRR